MWELRTNMGLFKIMMENPESIAYFYTPISNDSNLTIQSRKLRWIAHKIRIEAMIGYMTKMCQMDDWPAQTMVFLTFLANEKSPIPNYFLLPFENKMMAFKRTQKVSEFREDKRRALLIGCFLIIKVLVGKILFKPYKVTQYFDTHIDTLKEKFAFKENCISLGYTLIVLMTDLLYEMFLPEMKS